MLEASEEEVHSAEKEFYSALESVGEATPKEFDLSSLNEAHRNWQTENGRTSLENLKELLLSFNSRVDGNVFDLSNIKVGVEKEKVKISE